MGQSECSEQGGAALAGTPVRVPRRFARFLIARYTPRVSGRWRIIWLIALSAAAFISFLNGPDIVTSHEARVALPARTMAASGWPWSATPVDVPPVRLREGVVRLMPDWNAPPIRVNPWMVPVLDGQIRLQKPPLPYWCAAILFRLFGHFSELLVRLAPALLGALATLLLYDLARRTLGARIGWLAALVWVTTYAIPEEYRKAMADPYLAFFTLACVWAWTRAAMEPNHKEQRTKDKGQNPAPDRRSGGFLLLFYVCFALALLAKGPPAFITILLPLAAFHVCFKARPPGGAMLHALGLLIAFCIALPWPLYVWRTVPNVVEVWRYESVGELADNTEHARRAWFYLPQLLYLSLPWTAVLGVAIVLPLARVRKRLGSTFPLLWYASIVIFFSFVHLKKDQYLLPALPAQAMLIAQGLALVLAGARRMRFKGMPGAIVAIQSGLGVGLAIALPALVFFALKSGPRIAVLVAAVPLLLLALVPFRPMLRRRTRTWIVLQSATYVLLFVAFGRLYIQPLEDERSARPVAREVLALSRQPGCTLLASKLPEEVAIYLPIHVPVREFARHVFVIVDDQRGANLRARRHQPAPPVPAPDRFDGWLPSGKVIETRRVPLNSAPGDARWKVYDLTVERRGYAFLAQ